MKRFYVSTIAAGLALSMMGATLAVAQPDQNHPGGPAGTHEGGPPGHAAAPHATMQHQPMQQHAQMGPGHEAAHGPMPMQHQPMHMSQGGGHAGDAHQWHHGDRFNGDRRVVDNWSDYHASPPPPGYEWVQDGSQLILIGIASGIIANVLISGAYQ